MRVAAIDCGTNSLRLLVADVDEAGALSEVQRRMEVVRLGQGVDRTGELAADALARTFAVCRAYAEVIADLEVDRVRMVATSATRDARNRDAFFGGVREALGVEAEVISGAEEAWLSYSGATRTLPGLQSPCLVIDIGGGSTELAVGPATATSAGDLVARSLDIGAVRLHERHLHSDPPTADEIAAARRDVVEALAGPELPDWRKARTVVAVAGSATTIAAHALELPGYDPDAISSLRISSAELHRAGEALLVMTRAERSLLPFMHPGRVDVIGAGAIVLNTLIEELGLQDVVISHHDILDGIAMRLAAEPVF